MTSHNSARRVDRVSHLTWVPVALMRVSKDAQRDLKPGRVDQLAAEFDPEQIGIPVVSKRSGFFWIIDGQHRVAALVQIGWGDQQIQCEVYEELTEAEEAEMFLRRNNTLSVTAFAKFRVGVRAGRETEVAIDRLVRKAGLRVSQSKANGSVSAVGTLTKVYKRDGADALSRALCVIRDAYGTPGLEADLIDGVAMVIHRYGDDFDDATALDRLSTAMGSLNGLVNAAGQLKTTAGYPMSQCIASSIVTIYNRGRGGKKLPGWFRVSDPAGRDA